MIPSPVEGIPSTEEALDSVTQEEHIPAALQTPAQDDLQGTSQTPSTYADVARSPPSPPPQAAAPQLAGRRCDRYLANSSNSVVTNVDVKGRGLGHFELFIVICFIEFPTLNATLLYTLFIKYGHEQLLVPLNNCLPVGESLVKIEERAILYTIQIHSSDEDTTDNTIKCSFSIQIQDKNLGREDITLSFPLKELLKL